MTYLIINALALWAFLKLIGVILSHILSQVIPEGSE
jgi:hypothetical protein